MTISSSISRVTEYFKRNGLRATGRRLGLAIKRTLFSNRMVLFYRDVPVEGLRVTELPDSLKVERHRNQTSLSLVDLGEIASVWNPKLARRNIEERFELGASLWLIKFEGNLAGYGWTLQGRTVEPHYFPLGKDDVQFLDFHVFPKYRGRAIDWFLMTQILHSLAVEGLGRAYGEAGEWNQASISSFMMTPFRRLGLARKLTVFGRTIVFWSDNETAQQSTKVPVRAIDNPATGQ